MINGEDGPRKEYYINVLIKQSHIAEMSGSVLQTVSV